MTQKQKELIEKVEEVLNDLSDSKLMEVNNQYCQNNNYVDDEIFYMEELDEFVCIEGMGLTEILDKYGDINTGYKFFKFTVYGIEGFNDVADNIDMYDIAKYIVENDEDFDNDEIREVLDGEEEEEDEC